MRLYHGAIKPISGGRFSLASALSNEGNAAYGEGIYLTDSWEMARTYSGRNGSIYHVNFTPSRLVNDLTEVERRIVAEGVFDSLDSDRIELLVSDWAHDGQDRRDAKRKVVSAVMDEEDPSTWLSALQATMLSGDIVSLSKILTDHYGVDGSWSECDGERIYTVINDACIKIESVQELTRKSDRHSSVSDRLLPAI